MRITSDIPTEGQFIAIWEHKGDIWSDVVRYIDGVPRVYVEENYEFDGEFEHWETMENLVFIVKE